MRKFTFKDRTGEEHTTTQGYIIEIIKYESTKNVSVRFKDTDIIVENTSYNIVKNGNVRNFNYKSILGVGYIGYGVYKPTIDKEISICYTYWHSMLARCYNKKSQELSKNTRYINCNVNVDWHCFQIFAKWFYENYNPEIMEGWHLDKDILVKGNKTYSSETCCFVPHKINSLFTKIKKTDGLPIGVTDSRNNSYRITLPKGRNGVRCYKTIEKAFQAYKEVKENYIKEVADEWKDKINPKVCEAMYNHQVEITD